MLWRDCWVDKRKRETQMETREWYMIGGGVVLGVILLLVVLFACKTWRYFRPPSCSNLVTSKAEDLERPLVSYDAEVLTNQVPASAKGCDASAEGCDLEGPLLPKDRHLRPPPPRIAAGLIHKQRLPFSSPRFNQGVSVVVDVPNPAEEVRVGQTLKRSLSSSQSFEKLNAIKNYLNVDSEVGLNLEQPENVVIEDSTHQSNRAPLFDVAGYLQWPEDARNLITFVC